MKVFMLGWEFPPFISGGLGTACFGLTKAMSNMGIEVLFVLPRPVEQTDSTHVRMLTPKSTPSGKELHYKYEGLQNVQFLAVESMLSPYASPEYYKEKLDEVVRKKRQAGRVSGAEAEELAFGANEEMHYAGDMFSEIHRYANSAVGLATDEDFDVVHAHDWMTYP
ncbi:MAG: glycosyltransferase family 1 protein, partial [Planctomycetota bacterium]